MKIIVSENYQKLSEVAAEQFLKQLHRKKSSLFGLATGSSPVGMYEEIAKRKEDFSKAKSVNLDEYVSLSSSHPQSYARFMRENLFEKVNFDAKNTFIPCGTAPDLEKECARYDGILKKLGAIDLQILGLGHDGHIGFNEPGDIFEKDTHVVELQSTTIEANARFFSSKEEVPRRAITMGLRPIMNAKSILILVSGKSKAEIVKRAFFGPVTPKVPASILQLHPQVTLLVDREAYQFCES